MDLLKEEERLIEKLVNANQVVERKGRYLAKVQRSFAIAQREVKHAKTRVRKIRKQIRMQGVGDLNIPEPLDYPDENPVPTEESTD